MSTSNDIIDFFIECDLLPRPSFSKTLIYSINDLTRIELDLNVFFESWPRRDDENGLNVDGLPITEAFLPSHPLFIHRYDFSDVVVPNLYAMSSSDTIRYIICITFYEKLYYSVLEGGEYASEAIRRICGPEGRISTPNSSDTSGLVCVPRVIGIVTKTNCLNGLSQMLHHVVELVKGQPFRRAARCVEAFFNRSFAPMSRLPSLPSMSGRIDVCLPRPFVDSMCISSQNRLRTLDAVSIQSRGSWIGEHHLVPLLCLGTEQISRLLSWILTEERIVLLSCSSFRLTSIADAARTLLLPMKWKHVFLPSSKRLELIGNPCPYIIGLNDTSENEVRKWMKENNDNSIKILNVDSGKHFELSRAPVPPALLDALRPLQPLCERLKTLDSFAVACTKILNSSDEQIQSSTPPSLPNLPSPTANDPTCPQPFCNSELSFDAAIDQVQLKLSAQSAGVSLSCWSSLIADHHWPLQWAHQFHATLRSCEPLSSTQKINLTPHDLFCMRDPPRRSDVLSRADDLLSNLNDLEEPTPSGMQTVRRIKQHSKNLMRLPRSLLAMAHGYPSLTSNITRSLRQELASRILSSLVRVASKFEGCIDVLDGPNSFKFKEFISRSNELDASDAHADSVDFRSALVRTQSWRCVLETYINLQRSKKKKPQAIRKLPGGAPPLSVHSFTAAVRNYHEFQTKEGLALTYKANAAEKALLACREYTICSRSALVILPPAASGSVLNRNFIWRSFGVSAIDSHLYLPSSKAASKHIEDTKKTEDNVKKPGSGFKMETEACHAALVDILGRLPRLHMSDALAHSLMLLHYAINLSLFSHTSSVPNSLLHADIRSGKYMQEAMEFLMEIPTRWQVTANPVMFLSAPNLQLAALLCSLLALESADGDARIEQLDAHMDALNSSFDGLTDGQVYTLEGETQNVTHVRTGVASLEARTTVFKLLEFARRFATSDLAGRGVFLRPFAVVPGALTFVSVPANPPDGHKCPMGVLEEESETIWRGLRTLLTSPVRGSVTLRCRFCEALVDSPATKKENADENHRFEVPSTFTPAFCKRTFAVRARVAYSGAGGGLGSAHDVLDLPTPKPFGWVWNGVADQPSDLVFPLETLVGVLDSMMEVAERTQRVETEDTTNVIAEGGENNEKTDEDSHVMFARMFGIKLADANLMRRERPSAYFTLQMLNSIRFEVRKPVQLVRDTANSLLTAKEVQIGGLTVSSTLKKTLGKIILSIYAAAMSQLEQGQQNAQHIIEKQQQEQELNDAQEDLCDMSSAIESPSVSLPSQLQSEQRNEECEQQQEQEETEIDNNIATTTTDIQIEEEEESEPSSTLPSSVQVVVIPPASSPSSKNASPTKPRENIATNYNNNNNSNDNNMKLNGAITSALQQLLNNIDNQTNEFVEAHVDTTTTIIQDSLHPVSLFAASKNTATALAPDTASLQAPKSPSIVQQTHTQQQNIRSNKNNIQQRRISAVSDSSFQPTISNSSRRSNSAVSSSCSGPPSRNMSPAASRLPNSHASISGGSGAPSKVANYFTANRARDVSVFSAKSATANSSNRDAHSIRPFSGVGAVRRRGGASVNQNNNPGVMMIDLSTSSASFSSNHSTNSLHQNLVNDIHNNNNFSNNNTHNTSSLSNCNSSVLLGQSTDQRKTIQANYSSHSKMQTIPSFNNKNNSNNNLTLSSVNKISFNNPNLVNSTPTPPIMNHQQNINSTNNLANDKKEDKHLSRPSPVSRRGGVIVASPIADSFPTERRSPPSANTLLPPLLSSPQQNPSLPQVKIGNNTGSNITPKLFKPYVAPHRRSSLQQQQGVVSLTKKNQIAAGIDPSNQNVENQQH